MAPAYQIQADWHMDTTIWRWQMYGGKVLKARLQLRTRPQKHCYHQISTRKKKKKRCKNYPDRHQHKQHSHKNCQHREKTRKHWQHHHHAPTIILRIDIATLEMKLSAAHRSSNAWGCTLGALWVWFPSEDSWWKIPKYKRIYIYIFEIELIPKPEWSGHFWPKYLSESPPIKGCGFMIIHL